jgi:hypothetical protein
MSSTRVAAILIVVFTTPAAAQNPERLYAGVTVGSNYTSADDVDAAAVGAFGGTIGFKLSPAVSVQFDLTRGFGELTRQYEGIGVSFAAPDASREEIERLGVYQRFDRDWKPKVGWSAVVVFSDPRPGRARAAVFAGVSDTHFRERYSITTLRVPDGVDPNSRSIQPSHEIHNTHRGGPTVGAMVAIAVSHQVSIAPEIRYTYGSIGDEIYNVFSTGIRTLWRF